MFLERKLNQLKLLQSTLIQAVNNTHKFSSLLELCNNNKKMFIKILNFNKIMDL